jgi:type I restriction enzyme, S subunit
MKNGDLDKWSVVRLDEACDVILGQSPPGTSYNTDAKGLPFFQGKAEFGDLYPKAVKWCNQPSKIAEKDDVLISVRAPVGPTNLCPDRACIGRGLAALRPRDRIPSRYILYAVRSNVRSLAEQATGSTFDAISGSQLRAHTIPLAPSKDRQRIVAEIEKQFTRLDAGLASLERVQIALKRYRASVLKAACEGQFPHEPISVAIQSLDQGWSPKCEPVRSPSNDVWAVIKTSAIQHGRFVEEENKRLPTALRPRPHLELQSGDLLITRAGPRARAGVACLIKSTRPRLMLCDKAYRVRAKHDVANAAFLEIVLNAPHIVDAIDELKTGISDSGVNLTQRGFQGLVIPLPPLSEQQRIVADVERRLSVIEELEAIAAATVQRANRLRQAVLRAAFPMPHQSNRDTQ